MKSWKSIWNGMPAGDRKLVRVTAIVCGSVLMLSLPAFWFLAKHYEQGQEAILSSDSTAVHHEAPDSAQAEHPADQLADGGEGEAAPPPPAAVPTETSDPRDMAAHEELARILVERRDFSESLEHIRRIAPERTNDTAFLTMAGYAFLRAGASVEAAHALTQAKALGVQSPDVDAELALALYRSGKVDSAQSVVRKAIDAWKESPAPTTALATMIGEQNPLSREADSLFRLVLRTYPYHVEALYQYGRMLQNVGNQGLAYTQLQKALKLNPLDPRIHARMGMAQFLMGKDLLAEHSYRTALSLNPRDYNTWYNLGELELSRSVESTNPYRIRDLNRQAMECYLKTLEFKGDHGAAHYRVGILLNNNREYREAIRHLEQALTTDPHSVGILLQLGTAWEALGDNTTALDYFREAYQIDPFHRIVQEHLARVEKLLSAAHPS